MFCDNCFVESDTVREVSVEGMEVNALLCDPCVEDNVLENIEIGGK